ncbi:MAG: excinuclease subunit [Myxococcaceae bacterium]|nr:excinuclease subunit [Myxococcaceae bacterium]
MADLVVRGARQHNLKNLTICLPRDRLVVITGPSGSGKSSLAFDTIYAEAQRRYVESLSVYARQFLGQMPKPDVDGIDGLSPAISVRQQGTSRNPRSTVGTLTEIYDYLRLLYARTGVAHSPKTGQEMRAFSVEQVVDRALALPADARLTIAAPLPDADDEALALQLSRLRKEGFVRVAIDGVVHDLGEDLPRLKKGVHKLEVHIDRVRVKPSSRQRVSEAVELAYRQTGGFVRLFTEDGFVWLASERLVCLETGESYGELTPRTFSFNSPEGACPACGGLGVVHEFDPELVVPDPTLSIAEGAIAAWGRPEGAFYQRELESLGDALEVDLDKPWEKLPQALLKRVLFGAAARKKGASGDGAPWPGVLPALKERSAQLSRRKRGASDEVSDVLAYLEDDAYRFAREVVCSECEGTRLSPLARNVRVRGVTLPTLSALSLRELRAFFEAFDGQDAQSEVLGRLLKDITSRVSALVDLGLDYLALSRSVTTLSGGELERIRLATQIGSGLVGVLYVLDEPSAGLHARDNERLIASLHRLRDQGNSLVVVEHDEASIRAADYVVDLGPGAGVRGGELMAAGTPAELAAHAGSPTGAYLSGRARIERPAARPSATRWLELDDVRTHNLKNVSVRLPIGRLSCVTGVSGSGKSSLIIDSLLPAVKAQLRRRSAEPPTKGLRGAELLDRVIDVDQAPIGRTPRSSPASYVGAFDDLRELFASLPEARARGYGAARFSFNVKGGRCETCRGDGVVRVDMQFLPDVFVRCETCQGRRYNRETLEVRYRGYSVADVLEMSVETALALFAPVPKLTTKLGALKDVGLGYVALGQPANTLSGGEAQRIKLARELARRATGKTLLVLDEPTTGLHFSDVAVLIDLLERLVDLGNTVVVIEHHLELAKVADFVLDLGPEGGPEGGEIIAQGTPEQVAAEPRSHTGRYLKPLLAQSSPAR